MEVTTDFGAELATLAASQEAHPDADVTIGAAPAGAVSAVVVDPPPLKPAIEVTTDFGAAPAAKTAAPPPSASACAMHRDAIELGLSRGRNAMAIWQDLVDTRGFTGGNQSVKRFVRKLLGGPSKEACAVIETAAGEDYGKSRVMVRSGVVPSLLAGNLRRVRHITRYRASSHSMRLDDRRGVGACVGWGPFAESRALRFISRSA
jgi:hypothetical protein